MLTLDQHQKYWALFGIMQHFHTAVIQDNASQVPAVFTEFHNLRGYFFDHTDQDTFYSELLKVVNKTTRFLRANIRRFQDVSSIQDLAIFKQLIDETVLDLLKLLERDRGILDVTHHEDCIADQIMYTLQYQSGVGMSAR